VPDEEQAAESQACEQPLGRMRIAIVEDNADIRDTLGELLALEGHEVFLAGDGPSGLRVILENKPDVALLDLGLPRMDGYELARTVRSSCGSEVKLVALTGYGRDEDRAKSRQAGFNHHLVKPVEETVLARLLAEIEAAKGGPAGPQPSVIEVRSENEVRLRTPIGSGNNDN
jgi:CheY-like chemotaxis protein